MKLHDMVNSYYYDMEKLGLRGLGSIMRRQVEFLMFSFYCY